MWDEFIEKLSIVIKEQIHSEPKNNKKKISCLLSIVTLLIVIEKGTPETVMLNSEGK